MAMAILRSLFGTYEIGCFLRPCIGGVTKEKRAQTEASKSSRGCEVDRRQLRFHGHELMASQHAMNRPTCAFRSDFRRRELVEKDLPCTAVNQKLTPNPPRMHRGQRVRSAGADAHPQRRVSVGRTRWSMREWVSTGRKRIRRSQQHRRRQETLEPST